ncbi:unnamed protein product [Peronospora farinosa]|uniref:Uncharacterized protein n=1 Tax=Peronospora farinosa TaxID=134698 RepID=A0ABN8BUA2_9STRA|nr:unnamed protein product [Peronospora farinosa]
MTTALSALLVMAVFLPHVATSNDVTAPDVFTDKSIVTPTSDADPHDTLDLPITSVIGIMARIPFGVAIFRVVRWCQHRGCRQYSPFGGRL